MHRSRSATDRTYHGRTALTVRRAALRRVTSLRIDIHEQRTLRNFIDGDYVDARGDTFQDLIDPATEEVYARLAGLDRGGRRPRVPRGSRRRSRPGARRRRPSGSSRCSGSRMRWSRAPRSSPTSSRRTPASPARRSSTTRSCCRSTSSASSPAPPATSRAGRPASTSPDHTSFVRREPIGVVGQVTPWNYPLNMAVWKIAPAIAAGNTTVLKPSDTTPLATLLLAEVAAEFLPRRRAQRGHRRPHAPARP